MHPRLSIDLNVISSEQKLVGKWFYLRDGQEDNITQGNQIDKTTKKHVFVDH